MVYDVMGILFYFMDIIEVVVLFKDGNIFCIVILVFDKFYFK